MSSIDELTPIARLANAGPEPRWFVRTRLRHHGGFLVLGGEQEQGCDVERRHAVRLPVEPEKVHPGYKDGVRGSQEAGRPRGFDRLPQGRDQVSKSTLKATRFGFIIPKKRDGRLGGIRRRSVRFRCVF